MRTLALLAALLLLALQARAQVLQQTADQVPAQDQPEAQDQDQPDAEDQDVVISFTGEERLTRQASDHRKGIICYCSTSKYCDFPQKKYGTCKMFGRKHKLCCR